MVGRPRRVDNVDPEEQATTQTDVKPAKKKGRAIRWDDGSRMGHLKVPEGYAGRWCDEDDGNITKKLEQGWEFVNKTNYPQTGREVAHDFSDVKDGSGKSNDGLVRYRKMIGMMLPPDLKEDRDAFFRQKNRRQIESKIQINNDERGELNRAGANIKATLQVE